MDMRYDEFGSYWRCVQCGHTIEVAPPKPLPRHIGLKGNYYVFRYSGDADAFVGSVIYGRLRPGPAAERFDFECPFCDLAMKHPDTRHGQIWSYFCPESHRIYVDTKALRWA